MSRIAAVLVVVVSYGAAQNAQFAYDRSQPFDLICAATARQPDAEIRSCSIAGPRGGRVALMLVAPSRVRPPFAGIIFQHGGGTSMETYVPEALTLSREGVVSISADAPARGDGKNAEINATKLEAARDFQAEIVIIERRLVDLLLQQPGVDPKRIGYVGHSYGGIAGGVLAAVEDRLAALVLIGALPSYATHIQVNASPYWETMRNSMTPEEFTRTLGFIRETDPEHFLPKARAPALVQCARRDSNDNVRACPGVYRLLGGAKRLEWYDCDHTFKNATALNDRVAWLEKQLQLKH